MDPIVVLTDQHARTSPAINFASRLAPVLNADLVLLPLALPLPEAVAAPAAAAEGLALARLAHGLPVKATVASSQDLMVADAAHLLSRYHPQLVVLDRPADASTEADALRETVLELLRLAPFPVLVLPAKGHAESVWPPSRLILAADGDPYKLGEAAGVVRQLLRATRGSLTALRVTAPNMPASHHDAVQQTLDAGLVAFPLVPEVLHWIHQRPADGILAAAASTHAHLLVMVARRRSFWGSVFHQSVTADVMMRSPIPVLLLPTLD